MTTSENRNRFDAESHTYSISGVEVPSVTRILREVLPEAFRDAMQYYMDKGTAVHAACAFIAQGKTFTCDPDIEMPVTACRKFFADVKPVVQSVEHQGYSTLYQFAGTKDCLALIDKKLTIVDWKSKKSEVAEIQLGAYGILTPAATHGMVVELGADGKYKCSEQFKLDRRKNEFLAVRSVYSIKQRLKLIEKELSNE